jgi:hypothetical protein
MHQEKEAQNKLINEHKMQIKINKEKIHYYDEELKLIKNQLSFVKNVQKEYFTKLLNKGTDCR